tara:strand:+ start:2019 stop:2831 length:813 start_codon:yes stop_codon:yes gene_type:complete
MDEKMKLPWFEFYYQDFLTGTADFTHQQRGIYITLLCYAGVYNGKGLPNNFEKLCTIVNVYSNDPDKVESLKTDINTVLIEKFKLIDNKWHNERQLEDYKKTVEKINHRAEAGRKGGLAKAKQTSSKCSVSVSDSVSVSFNNIWDALMVKRGSKKKALEKYKNMPVSISEDLIIDKYNELCRNTENQIFIPHFSTWLSQERYNDEEVFNLDSFKKKHGITANFVEEKDDLLFFMSKESWGMMDWIYKKDGTSIKAEDYFGKKEEKKTATN